MKSKILLLSISLSISTMLFAQDVYVAGSDGGSGKIWKNGTPQNLAFPATAVSVFASGNDVYAAGMEDDGTTLAGVLWKNGIPEYLTDHSPHTMVNSVFVSSSDVYVSGTENNGSSIIAKIWKNGVPQTLTNGSNHAEANAVFVSGGDVYVAGAEKTAAIM